MKVREVLRLLADDGWGGEANTRIAPATRAPDQAATCTVAGKPSTDLPPGTLRSILRQAGLHEAKEDD